MPHCRWTSSQVQPASQVHGMDPLIVTHYVKTRRTAEEGKRMFLQGWDVCTCVRRGRL